MGYLKLPEGKKIAVNLGTDFDAQSLWMGRFNKPSPSFMSRGEYGAEVGVPRLLGLYDKFDVKTTWFTPGHMVDTFPEACEAVAEKGHEFGHHGYFHENPTLIDAGTEAELVERAFDTFDRRLGVRPTGYRSPYWDYSDNTLDVVEKYGFKYDSSLMGRDLVAYRPQRWAVDWENGNKVGKPATCSKFLSAGTWMISPHWVVPWVFRPVSRILRRFTSGGATSSTMAMNVSKTLCSPHACIHRPSASHTI